jgi:serine/threonine-protein kinase HipA
MIAVADVKIWDHKVGVVLWDQQRNYGVFEYDKQFFKLGLDLNGLKKI